MWHLCESLILSCGFSCLYLLGCSTSHTQLQGKFFVAVISVALFPAPFKSGSEILPHSELTLQTNNGGFKQLFFLPFLRPLTFINQPRFPIFCAASVLQWHNYQSLLVLESDFPQVTSLSSFSLAHTLSSTNSSVCLHPLLLLLIWALLAQL